MPDLQEVLRKKLLEAKKRNLKEIFGVKDEEEEKDDYIDKYIEEDDRIEDEIQREYAHIMRKSADEKRRPVEKQPEKQVIVKSKEKQELTKKPSASVQAKKQNNNDLEKQFKSVMKKSSEVAKKYVVPEKGEDLMQDARKHRIVGGEEADKKLEYSPISRFYEGKLGEAVTKKQDKKEDYEDYEVNIDISEEDKEKIRKKARDIIFQRIKSSLEQYGR